MQRYPAEVRADLQHYYNLNIDKLGADFSAFHAAACLICMPAGSSQLYARIDKRLMWNLTEYKLHSIHQSIVGKEIPYPWDKPETNLPELEAIDIDEFEKWHSKKRKEGEKWQVIQ